MKMKTNVLFLYLLVGCWAAAVPKAVGQTIYAQVSIIGDAASGWATDVAMHQSPANPAIWYLDNLTLSVGEFKFRANNDWAENWGGTALSGTATPSGANIPVTTAGSYQITFNTVNLQYIVTTGHSTIGFIGDTTPNGWSGDDIDLTQDPDNPHLWKISNYTLFAGTMKFRAGNSWAFNWGGSTLTATGELFGTGNDIPVATAQAYDLSFNDLTWQYSIYDRVVTLHPANPSPTDAVTITFDATKGNGLLAGATAVYIHTGVVTSDQGTAWEYVKGNWGQDDATVKMTQVANQPNKWEITLSPSIRSFYGFNAGVPAFRLSMVFRDQAGSLVGKSAADTDIYLDIDPGDHILIAAPTSPNIFVEAGGTVDFSASASEPTALFKTYVNSTLVSTDTDGNATTHYTYAPTADGSVNVTYEAQINGLTISRSVTYYAVVRAATVVQDPPPATPNGPSYHAADPTKVTLTLLAPGKQFAYAIGDFNNWTPSNNYLMNKSADGKRFWITLTDLTPGQEYVYQYLVDGSIKVADPFAEKVADPFADGDIPTSVYPNLPAYTNTTNGRATVFQTNQTAYNWSHTEVAGGRPQKEDLIIYELLVRDFIASHDYQGVIDKLPYLKNLGINVLELMPVNEFEGNVSWGYNPNFYFAPDKYYGTKNKLKELIDKCHENGIAVVVDMVLNHSFNSSPFVQLYYNELAARPAANNPWHNQTSNFSNPNAQWGSDFNQESAYTRALVDSVNQYWLHEYHVDGFRFDFTKGFSNTPFPNANCADEWGSCYDAARIANLKRMADQIWATESDAYIICEHFAPDNEEVELTNYGMMVWASGQFHQYQELVLGNVDGSDLNRMMPGPRGSNNLHYIGFMESHDEERLVYKAQQYGLSNGSYDVKNLSTALERIKTLSAFFLTIPGPKMLYQFGELGYDISLNHNGRTGEKPIIWEAPYDYDGNAERMKIYKVMAALAGLRHQYKQVFKDGYFEWISGGQMRRINLSHTDLSLTVVANFGVTASTIAPNFQHTGFWYDFFGGGNAVYITDPAAAISLNPGEFKVFVNKNTVTFPETGLVNTTSPFTANHAAILLEPTGGVSAAMSLIADNLWEIGNLQFAGGTFRFTNGSGVHWGDEQQDGTAEAGSTLAIAVNLPAGRYNVRFNDQTLAYHFSTVHNRSMFFRGAFNTWGATPMQLVAADTWQATDVNFTADEFKFANTTDWSGRNYGSTQNGNPGLAADLANSAVNVTAGVSTPYHYTVIFNDNTQAYLFLAIPSDLTVQATSATSVTLTWQWPTAPGNLPNAKFQVERSTDNFANSANTVAVAEIADPAARSFSDSGLQAGTVYYYRVRAVN